MFVVRFVLQPYWVSVDSADSRFWTVSEVTLSQVKAKNSPLIYLVHLWRELRFRGSPRILPYFPRFVAAVDGKTFIHTVYFYDLIPRTSFNCRDTTCYCLMEIISMNDEVGVDQQQRIEVCTMCVTNGNKRRCLVISYYVNKPRRIFGKWLR